MYLTILLVFKIWATIALASAAGDDDKKHDYTIELKKANVEIVNEMYMSKDTHFLVVMYNDTKAVLEAVFDFVKAPPEDMMVKIIASLFDKTTNQYLQKFSLTQKFCDFMETNHYIMDNLYKDSNFPKQCPITSGNYYVKNMVIDNSEFPKHVEASEWRAEVELNVKGNMGLPYLVVLVDADAVPIEEEFEEEE